MNNIKVTVDYQLPNTDKFDALIEQYLAMKAITDTTKETMIPLIQEGGKAKYDAICEQLFIIGQQLKKISLLSNKSPICISAYYGNNHEKIIVEYFKAADVVEIYYNNRYGCSKYNFLDWENKKDNLLSLGGLVTNWNNYNIIEKLQEQCDFILKSMINNQKREAEKIASTLEKIRS